MKKKYLCQVEIGTLDRASSGPGGCLDGGGTVPPVVSQPPGQSAHHPEITPPNHGRRTLVDRCSKTSGSADFQEKLRRRLEIYRTHQKDCIPRFDQSFTGQCEQNFQDTLQLKQRYLDTKSKKVLKSKDKKQQESIQSSVHVQQKFLKRSSEEYDAGGSSENFEPPMKLQCTTQQQHNTHQNEGLTKFSVEIVQQLEFTTSAANSQPQQISTNVTVKAHTNASVKSDVSSPKSNPSTPASNLQQKSNIGLDVGTLVECVKQEPDNDFADLDQCAAALEKDAANGGAGFGNFADLIGEDTNDEIITSDAFNDLISDISNYPELMKDFDFEDKSEISANGLKVEDIKDLPQTTIPESAGNKSTQSPLVTPNQNNFSPPVFDNQNNIPKNRMPPYSNMDFCKTELSPAAQTLKQMAEQHQHKNQIGMSFNPTTRTPNSRSPYPDFQFQGDYGSPNSNSNFHKNSPNFVQTDMIKQEMIFQNNEFDMKRKNAGIYKQQYSPYSSPSASSHGSPGYLPRGNTNSSGGPPTGGPYGGGTPPRPPSGPGGNNSGTTLQINQAQQLHINQQNHGHAIQVSAGQHVHLSGDLKGNVSIATQQGLHFNQHASANNNTSTGPQGQNQNSNQQNPLSSSNQQQSHQQNPQMHNNSQQQQQQQPQQQQQQQPQQPQQSQQPPPTNNQPMGNPMMGNNQQMPNNQSMGGMPGPGPPGPGGHNMPPNGMLGPGNMQHPSGLPNNIPGQMQETTYSMSQTQTINFTQQTLRQRANGPNVVPNAMGPNGGMGPGPMGNQGGLGPRLMNQQTLEQQKLMQQQQMLRAQQAAAMQQHMVRPPPPDYKTSAGMMQGMPPNRYAGVPPNMRRMPQQPMPPSGPMIRPHMYMMQQQQQQPQQQHMVSRNMYPRQQGPMGGIDPMQHSSNEWRHIIMSQQQNTNFNPQMRPNLQQQGFGMNSGNMQLSALQHQQIRAQQGMVSSMGPNQQVMSQSQVMGASTNPMAQMNNMNQQMINHMQQQQSLMQQQNSQMSMSSIHMQQTQSMSLSNQNLQHQQQTLNNHQLVNSATNQNNQLNNFNSQADFSLEFLDNLPTTDSTFTDQELLNSFDSDSGFNLDF